jgi:hypothetical protein
MDFGIAETGIARGSPPGTTTEVLRFGIPLAEIRVVSAVLSTTHVTATPTPPPPTWPNRPPPPPRQAAPLPPAVPPTPHHHRRSGSCPEPPSRSDGHGGFTNPRVPNPQTLTSNPKAAGLHRRPRPPASHRRLPRPPTAGVGGDGHRYNYFF